MLRPFGFIKVALVKSLKFLFFQIERLLSYVFNRLNFTYSLGMPIRPEDVNIESKDFVYSKFTNSDVNKLFHKDSYNFPLPELKYSTATTEIDTPLRVLFPYRGISGVPYSEKVMWYTKGTEYARELGYQAFYMKPHRSMGTLPEWLASLLNQYISNSDYVTVEEVDDIRKWFIVIIGFYLMMASVKMTMSVSFISWNPYASLPTIILFAFYDWIEEYFGSLFGVLLGIPVATPIVLAFIGLIQKKLLCLIITTPYLPSEGYIDLLWPEVPAAAGKIGIAMFGPEPILSFTGIPKQWLINGIPNSERLDWYFNKRHILEYMYNTFGEQLKLVPDYIP